jgi:hypothetical protein
MLTIDQFLTIVPPPLSGFTGMGTGSKDKATTHLPLRQPSYCGNLAAGGVGADTRCRVLVAGQYCTLPGEMNKRVIEQPISPLWRGSMSAIAIFRQLSLRRAATVLAVEATLDHALHHDIGLRHNKERVFGPIHDILIGLLQRLRPRCRESRQCFSPSQFHSVAFTVGSRTRQQFLPGLASPLLRRAGIATSRQHPLLLDPIQDQSR